jgi:hypothetical protein
MNIRFQHLCIWCLLALRTVPFLIVSQRFLGKQIQWPCSQFRLQKLYRTCSSGQSICLQIQRYRVRFPALPDFWEVMGLERGPLSLAIINEELFKLSCSGRGLEKQS